MYLKGPPENTGFMWCNKNDLNYWTEKESKALKLMANKILDLGWDSSSYGFMQRIVQDKIKNIKSSTNIIY